MIGFHLSNVVPGRSGRHLNFSSPHQTSYFQTSTMPPIRGQKAQKSVEQEGRILLAIKAIKNRRFTSVVAAAARSFEVPRSTLQDRMKGITSWSDTSAIGHKFTQLEEESIQDWLISMDHRGAALTIAMLRGMANLLLKNRGEHTPQTVSKN
jgi:hypothetical protein